MVRAQIVEDLVKRFQDGDYRYRLINGWGFVMSPRAVMALSGGMDSTSLFLRLLAEGYHDMY